MINDTYAHMHRSNQHTLTAIKTRDCTSTYCVETFEQMFWGKLTSAVLYVHAPIELSILAAYETHSIRAVASDCQQVTHLRT